MKPQRKYIPTNKVLSTSVVTLIGCMVVIYAEIKSRHTNASTRGQMQQQGMAMGSAINSSSSPKLLNYSDRFLNQLNEEQRTCILEHKAQFNREEYDTYVETISRAACAPCLDFKAVWWHIANPQKSALRRQKTCRLPELGIVMTISASHVNGWKVDAVHNLEVWAAKHNYHFHFAVINTSDWMTLPGGTQLYHFFTARWQHLRSVYWKRYKWLLHVDGDVLILNLDKNIDKWLAMDQEMIFHMNWPGDLTASAVLLRTAAFSWCFMNDWISLGDVKQAPLHPDFDNGDMYKVVMDYIDPPLATECNKQFRIHNHKNFIRCFHKLHPTLETVHEWAPIRVAFPRAVDHFWRPFGRFRASDARKNIGTSRVCTYNSDIMGHGWKAMASVWQGNTKNVELAFNSTIPAGCIRITPEEELETAKKMCYIHFPGCVVDGVNVCAEQPRCKEREYPYITILYGR